MPSDYAVPFDILTRVIKFVKEDQVYAIIVAEDAYATPNSDSEKGVTLIDTHSDPAIFGVTGTITATLLETSTNAGEDFATLASAGGPEAARNVYGLVVPKPRKEVQADFLANWFEMYVVPINRDHVDPTAPLLWRLTPLQCLAGVAFRFKITNDPHIVGGPEGEGTDPMVQMYPMSGTNPGQFGWQCYAYRTDQEGTGQMFQQPPEWTVDVVGPLGQLGLLFGKDPPLIAADVPFEE